jgi:hypothetical protein
VGHEQDAVDTEILEQATAESGAVVMGRRLFDIVNAPDGWNKDMGYGADQTGTPPFFVVTYSPPQTSGWNANWGCASPSSAICHRDRPGAVRRDPW